jgi:hypothetical protein
MGTIGQDITRFSPLHSLAEVMPFTDMACGGGMRQGKRGK